MRADRDLFRGVNDTLTRTLRDVPDVQWGASVLEIADMQEVASFNGDAPLSTASIGKVLLLIEVAETINARPEWSVEQVRRTPADSVGDSGLWQHMSVEALPVRDVALLVAAHSDNLATNALLRVVGLDSVQSRAMALGLTTTTLHDQVRDARGPGVPERLSSGSARELAALAARLDGGGDLDPAIARIVTGWLRVGTDLSMVPATLELDPLAHVGEDRGWVVWNKTGTDTGVRGDVGVIRRGERAVAYALIANWAGSVDPRDDVLAAMRRFGSELCAILA